jgi:hypothetical protein
MRTDIYPIPVFLVTETSNLTTTYNHTRTPIVDRGLKKGSSVAYIVLHHGNTNNVKQLRYSMITAKSLLQQLVFYTEEKDITALPILPWKDIRISWILR